MLPFMIFEWTVTLSGCKVFGKNKFKESQSRNSFVPTSLSRFDKSTLNSSKITKFFFPLRHFEVVCFGSYIWIHWDSSLSDYIYNSWRYSFCFGFTISKKVDTCSQDLHKQRYSLGW